MVRVLVVVCGAVLLLAGCGTAVQTTSTVQDTTTTTSATETPSSTKTVARALADWAVLPAGSTRLAPSAPGTPRSPDVEPAGPALVDYSQQWSAPMSMAEAASFLRTHAPTGTTVTGSSSTLGGTGGIGVIDSATPLPAGMCFAQLVFSLVSDGTNHTLIRVDGQAIADCAVGPHS